MSVLSPLFTRNINNPVFLQSTANYIRSINMPPAIMIELFLTEDCTLRCDYCFVRGKNPRSMELSTLYAAIDYLFLYSHERENLEILFFGGEPFLRFDMIQEVVSYVERKNAGSKKPKKISFSTTTNGTLLTEPVLKYCYEKNVKFLLSIDGLKEDHDQHRRTPDGNGSFDLIAPRIPLMKRYQPWLGTRITYTPATVCRLTHNIRSLHSMGINQFLLGHATHEKWDQKSLDTLVEQLGELRELYIEMKKKKSYFRMTIYEKGNVNELSEFKNIWGCGAGRSRFCIGVDGTIFGCSKFRCANDDLTQNKGIYPLGDVWKGLSEIETRLLFLKPHEEKRVICMKCDLRDYCSGGCPAFNAYITGDPFLPAEQECAITRIYHENALKMIQRLKEENLLDK